MQVKELIAKLQGFDPKLEVLCYTEDDNSSGAAPSSVFFDIQSIGKTRGQMVRSAQGKPGIRFNSEADSVEVVLIDITSDF